MARGRGFRGRGRGGRGNKGGVLMLIPPQNTRASKFRTAMCFKMNKAGGCKNMDF